MTSTRSSTLKTRGPRASRRPRPSDTEEEDLPPLASDSEAEQPAILYDSDSEDAGPRPKNRRSLERFGGPGWVRSRASSPALIDSEDELETS